MNYEFGSAINKANIIFWIRIKTADDGLVDKLPPVSGLAVDIHINS